MPLQRIVDKPVIQDLPTVESRLSFLYVEKCTLERDNNALLLTDKQGVVYIPAAMLTALLVGPGVCITHRAMELAGLTGVTIVWVGEGGTRYYAHSVGNPLTHRSILLMRQAEYVSNTQKHLNVARAMYQMRFPDEDVSKLSMHQLRGREGSRVKKLYKKFADEYHVKWETRTYNTEDYFDSDLINQLLTAGNICLYGMAQSVICALGCSPGLGFVHVGHELSFVYDIADLYKAHITLPVAFSLAAELKGAVINSIEEPAMEMRRRMRDKIKECKLLGQMVKDVEDLLQCNEAEKKEIQTANILYLWDDRKELIKATKNYGESM